LWQTFFIYFKNVSSDFCTESTLDWNPKNRYLETLEIRENLNSNSITEDRYLKSQKRERRINLYKVWTKKEQNVEYNPSTKQIKEKGG